MSHCQFKGSKCEKQLFFWLHITRSSLSYEAALRFRGTMQEDEQLRQRRFAFPGTGQCGGAHTAPPKPSWLCAGGSTQPPESCSLGCSCSRGPSPGAVWEQHPPGTCRLGAASCPAREAGNKSDPITGASVFALGIDGFLGSRQDCVHPPFVSPALFFKYEPAGGRVQPGSPTAARAQAVPASTRCSSALPLLPL